jgi:hypothetical protein
MLLLPLQRSLQPCLHNAATALSPPRMKILSPFPSQFFTASASSLLAPVRLGPLLPPLPRIERPSAPGFSFRHPPHRAPTDRSFRRSPASSPDGSSPRRLSHDGSGPDGSTFARAPPTLLRAPPTPTPPRAPPTPRPPSPERRRQIDGCSSSTDASSSSADTVTPSRERRCRRAEHRRAQIRAAQILLLPRLPPFSLLLQGARGQLPRGDARGEARHRCSPSSFALR